MVDTGPGYFEKHIKHCLGRWEEVRASQLFYSLTLRLFSTMKYFFAALVSSAILLQAQAVPAVELAAAIDVRILSSTTLFE